MSRWVVVDVTGPPAPETPAAQVPVPPPSAAAPLDPPLDPLRLPEPPLSDAPPLSAEALPLGEPLPLLDPLVFDPLLPAELPLPTDAAPLDVDPLVAGPLGDPVVELASESTETWAPSEPEQPQKARVAATEREKTTVRHDRTACQPPSFTFTGFARSQCIPQVCREDLNRSRTMRRKSRRRRAVRWGQNFTRVEC